ncbi:MAG: response regulator transcription factor [Saprospiraceae bacterium]|nr:response regulator transcription factor [Saprospiraceae bacterium]
MTQTYINVFIADDHPVVVAGISSLFQKASGIVLVGSAQSSDELFTCLPQVRPQVLLLDLNICGQDYTKNIQQLKKDFPWVKVLIYSGYQSYDLAKSLIDMGAQGYLHKSAEPEQLVEAIQSVHNGTVYYHPVRKIMPQKKETQSAVALTDDFQKRLRLSKREQEILVLISKGLTSQRIGNALFISKYTVETHRKNILRKLDLNSSTELVKFAIQQGLL